MSLGVYSNEFHKDLVAPRKFLFSYHFGISACVFVFVGALLLLFMALRIMFPPAGPGAGAGATGAGPAYAHYAGPGVVPVRTYASDIIEDYRPHPLAFVALLFVLVALILAIVAAALDTWSQSKSFLPPGSPFVSISNWRSISSGGKAAFAFVLLTIIFCVPTLIVGGVFAMGGSRRSGFAATGLCFFTMVCALVTICVYGGQVYAKQAEEKRYRSGFYLAVSAWVFLLAAVPLFFVTILLRVPTLLHRAGAQAPYIPPPAAPTVVIPPAPREPAYVYEPAIVPVVVPPKKVVQEESYTYSYTSEYESTSENSSSSSSSSSSTEIITIITQRPAPPQQQQPQQPQPQALPTPRQYTYAPQPVYQPTVLPSRSPVPLYSPAPPVVPPLIFTHLPVTPRSSSPSATMIDARIREPVIVSSSVEHHHRSHHGHANGTLIHGYE